MEEKKTYKQLDLDKRKVIERYLDEGKTFARIAYDLDVDASTVYREVFRNRRCDGMSHSKGADKTDCEWLKSCKRQGVCDFDRPFWDGKCERKLCKRCHMIKCADVCQHYERRICPTVLRAPLTCNACERYPRCTIERFKYSAENAQASAERRNSESRRGFDLDSRHVEYMVKTVRAGLRLGHSIHHIFLANEMPCSERTFYRLVEDYDFPIIGMELAKKAKYKKRKHTKKDPIHPRGFYKDREYADYLDLPLSERMVTTQIDTVWGTARDRKTILSLHRIDLHFQIYLLLAERTASEVVAALDWLEQCCEGRFSEFFGLLLGDRGSEFDDFDGIEMSSGGDNQRARIFYTDSGRADQKGCCEKNHVELRKVIPKGTSLAKMDPFILSDVCSHVNSTIRLGCGDSTPMQLAQLCLPPSLFENLGLRLVPPNEVISTPGILYDPNK